MPIDAIKIPQNVYIEDRIVGPLTLRQVLICVVGGGISYALFASISKSYGVVPLPIQIAVWIPAAISVIFAFVRINDLSMMRLCLLMLERLNKPTTRTWTPRRGIIINVRTFHTAAEDKKQSKLAAFVEKKPEKIEELSSILDTQKVEEIGPQHLDDPMEEDLSPMAEELPETPDLDTTENVNVVRRPVDPSRISVSAIEGGAVDGVAKTGSVSIFRDISPAHPH